MLLVFTNSILTRYTILSTCCSLNVHLHTCVFYDHVTRSSNPHSCPSAHVVVFAYPMCISCFVHACHAVLYVLFMAMNMFGFVD